jgi:4-hydroxy 2-oxovalerate aldolase
MGEMKNFTNSYLYKRIHRLFYPKKKKNVRLYTPDYLNRHKGRDFLVLGMGPSVAKYLGQIEYFVDENNLIVMGTNNCFNILSKIDYHVFTSRHRFIDYGQRLNDSSCSKVLLSPYIPEYTIRKIYQGPYESIMYKNDNDRHFGIKDGIIQSSCKSVALLSVALAMAMGANKVFIVGVDGWLKLIKEKMQLHCNDSQPKYSWQEDEKFLNHYSISQKYHKKVLNEFSKYLNKNNREMFSIITPTEYAEYYSSKYLNIENTNQNG